jgi:hypothetical protein
MVEILRKKSRLPNGANCLETGHESGSPPIALARKHSRDSREGNRPKIAAMESHMGPRSRETCVTSHHLH